MTLKNHLRTVFESLFTFTIKTINNIIVIILKTNSPKNIG